MSQKACPPLEVLSGGKCGMEELEVEFSFATWWQN